MGRMKLVKRRRRRPDGSYEWILDTPDWYERELRRKEFEQKYVDPALSRMIDAGEHVSRYVYHRVMPWVEDQFWRFLDVTVGNLYERVTTVKVEDTPESRAVERFMDFVMGPFSKIMSVVVGIFIYGFIAYLIVRGLWHFFDSVIKWIAE